LDPLNVLRAQLLCTTNYTQFLKSRSGLALSLFNFCRCLRPLVWLDYSTDILRKESAFIPLAKASGFTALFGKDQRGSN
jgi:hypothetical protein